MNIYLVIALRLVHIFAGVFWAGAVFMVAGFITPAAASAGPEGGKFIQRLVQERRLSLTMSIAAWLTTLSGLILYWWSSGGLAATWIVSGTGLALTIGGLAGVATFVIGLVVNAPAAKRLAAVAGEMQSAGGPPKPEQLAEMKALQERIANGGIAGALLLAVSVVGMAVAQYLF
jgi:uncharacterized membrane protein